MSTTISRRKLIKTGLALSAVTTAMFTGLASAEWPKLAYQQKSQQDAMSKLYGDKAVQDSSQIKLKAPELAENGAVVPIRVETGMPNVKSISIFVEKNPNPLAARFNMGSSQQGKVATRIKLAKESNVTAVVETDHGVFKTSKHIKVTRGGCGG